MKQNPIKEKSFRFALKVVEVSRSVAREHNEFDLTRQLKRSGTAVGALIREAEQAESKRDFIHKLAISLKEANETEYWIDLLFQSNMMTEEHYFYIREEAAEMNRLLISIIRNTKLNLAKKGMGS
jgi:four helix bundle protein